MIIQTPCKEKELFLARKVFSRCKASPKYKQYLALITAAGRMALWHTWQELVHRLVALDVDELWGLCHLRRIASEHSPTSHFKEPESES